MIHSVLGRLVAPTTITFILVHEVPTSEHAHMNFHLRFAQQVDGQYLKSLKLVLSWVSNY